MPLVGGHTEKPIDSPEVVELSKFVLSKLSEGDEKEKLLVEIVKATTQVVSGTLTKLTLKISDGGVHRICEASVWEQPWLNKREVTKIRFLDESNNS